MINSFFIMLYAPHGLLFALMIAVQVPSAIHGVRCFCTEDHCSFGVCDSDWCLVGIKSSGPVLRTCGNEAAKLLKICRRGVSDWHEVCACDTPFCNTFAFLRHQIKHNRFADNSPIPAPPKNGDHPELRTALVEDSDEIRYEVNKQNRREKYPTTNFVKGKDGKTVRKYQVSYLAIVLIVVPLSVGASAILVIALNYYCHLC